VIPGLRVGHSTGACTGVTVVLCPPGTVASIEIRGGAPATRETALLEPGRSVEHVDAVVLSGGSAFGLAAADGVMAWLADRGRGFPTRAGPVPIVPAACIYDLVEGGELPGPEHGRAAVEAADSDAGTAPPTGSVGAGRGATVGKWRVSAHAVPGGLGVATVSLPAASGEESEARESLTVGAMAVVNAVGDVIDAAGRIIAGSTAPADAEAFPVPEPFADTPESVLEATTLVVVATDLPLTKAECHLLAQSGHHGLARAVHPSHTRYDGDLVIALSCRGERQPVPSHPDPPDHEKPDTTFDRVRIAATEVVADAVRNAVRQT
jgi:L-aminopeptidase/D-esterase-like protein